MISATSNCFLRRALCVVWLKKAPNTQRQRHDALTFIELLVVIAIMGILIGVSLPRFRKTFNSLQLTNFSRELQVFMNYLRERAIVEGKIAYLNIDSDQRQYWAQIKDDAKKIRTYHIPSEIKLETDQQKIAFYPDGSIDKVTIKILNIDNQTITLTTQGVLGSVRLKE